MNTINDVVELDTDDVVELDTAVGICLQCGMDFDWARFKLGYKVCMVCGDKLAKGVRRCVVPLNKSNYMMVTDMNILKQLNPKRTM